MSANREPTLEGLLAQILGVKDAELAEAAGAFDERSIGHLLHKRHQQQLQAMRSEAALFARVFLDSADGRQVLERMLDATLRQPMWPLHQAGSMEMLNALGLWNEAQGRFVHLIVELLAMSQAHVEEDEGD